MTTDATLGRVEHLELIVFGLLVGTAARVGEPAAWSERARLVAAAGTPTQIVGSAQRWFAPGFIERDAFTTTGLLHALQDADRFSYARACEALAGFDATGRLGAVDVRDLLGHA